MTQAARVTVLQQRSQSNSSPYSCTVDFSLMSAAKPVLLIAVDSLTQHYHYENTFRGQGDKGAALLYSKENKKNKQECDAAAACVYVAARLNPCPAESM